MAEPSAELLKMMENPASSPNGEDASMEEEPLPEGELESSGEPPARELSSGNLVPDEPGAQI